MKQLYCMVAMATLVAPAFAQDQGERISGPRQKMWLPSNFRLASGGCALVRLGDGFAVSGTGSVSFDNDETAGEGIDLAVSGADAVVPTLTAHAINTKGTGATNHRSAEQPCGLMPSPRGTIPAGRVAARSVATCTVSGDPDAPDVRFVLPLSTFGAGAAKTYVGHVTLMKRADSARLAAYGAKKGYDYYKELSDMGSTVVATCDASALTAKGGGAASVSYDLAVNKKA